MKKAAPKLIGQGVRKPGGFLRRGLFLPLAALAFALASCIAAFGNPPSQSPREYQVKAAFLYNFAKFIEWPSNVAADPNSPFVLGIMGDDPFGADLEQTINGKAVNGRRLVIKRFKRGQPLDLCQILFISSSEQGHLTQILDSLKGSSVLTVGEADHFAQSGGIINFTLKDDRVRFEINLGAADRARLKISSKLLVLGEVVGNTAHGN
ncbi:MAG: YfiR family protein [Terriglobia bacterium]